MAFALKFSSSSLRELDLSDNDLQDAGVKLLCVGLKHPQCKLEVLRLTGCQVTQEGCEVLASALQSNPSNLKELDLSYNHPGDTGVTLLSTIVENPNFRLEKLTVDHIGITRLKSVRKKCMFVYYIFFSMSVDLKVKNTFSAYLL